METKKLGFGLMRLPELNSDNGIKDGDTGVIDLEQVNQMVDTFLERGFTYFDTTKLFFNINT